MREITQEEVEAVGGAFGVPGAVAGGVAGGAAYVGSLTGGGTFKGGEFAAAVGTGALTGAITGPAGVARTLGMGAVGFGSGVITGNAGRLGNGGGAGGA